MLFWKPQRQNYLVNCVNSYMVSICLRKMYIKICKSCCFGYCESKFIQYIILCIFSSKYYIKYLKTIYKYILN